MKKTRISKNVREHVLEIRHFVQRCHDKLSEKVREITDEQRKIKNQQISKWNNENREKLRALQKEYAKTDKGSYAVSKRNSNRGMNYKLACSQLHWDERILIGRFYKNCPPGYEVDHIVPISRGGKHTLSNLQYLTKEDNRKKSAKSWEEYKKQRSDDT